MHSSLSGVIDILEASGVNYSILTNGFWRDPAFLLSSLEKRERFQGFLVSLHGSEPDHHDEFVGVKGSFNIVTKNIETLTRNGFYVTTNTILNKYTVKHVDDIAALAHSLGATYAAYNRYYGADKRFSIPKEELKYAAEKITKDRISGQLVRLGNCVPLCLADCDCDGCPAGNFALTIDPWLRVRPCNHAPVIVGSLRENSLYEIWHGHAMNRWRAFVPSQCLGCTSYSICAAGCRAEAILNDRFSDPLIVGNWSLNRDSTLPLVKFYSEQTLEILYKSRRDDFGMVLFYEGEVVLVNHESAQMLECVSNGTPVRDIVSEYGHDSLRVLGELLLRGFVRYSN